MTETGGWKFTHPVNHLFTLSQHFALSGLSSSPSFQGYSNLRCHSHKKLSYMALCPRGCASQLTLDTKENIIFMLSSFDEIICGRTNHWSINFSNFSCSLLCYLLYIIFVLNETIHMQHSVYAAISCPIFMGTWSECCESPKAISTRMRAAASVGWYRSQKIWSLLLEQ